MDRPRLNDPNLPPTDDVIAAELKSAAQAYREFVKALPGHQIDLEWRYYNDGKSWLGKATAKKKTVFWLSVWEGYFKVSLFFTEKTRVGVQALPIDDALKNRLANEPVKGKLIALILDLAQSGQLADALTLVAYKKSCK